MKLVHPLLEKPILFEENMANILVVENQKVFAEMVWELFNQTNGGEGQFILSSELKQLELNKRMDLVIDLFSLDFNQKKILNKLFSQLKEIATGGEYYEDSMCLIGEITTYLERIMQSIQYPLGYNSEFDISTIFKLVDVKIDITYETLLEKIIDYITLIQEFLGINLFVFVNLKCFLSFEELEQLYLSIAYKKCNILLLENSINEKRLEQEIIRIIDSDLCEI